MNVMQKQNKNFDGIAVKKPSLPKRLLQPKIIVKVDAVVLKRKAPVLPAKKPKLRAFKRGRDIFKLFNPRFLPYALAGTALFMAFITGAYTAWNAHSSLAEKTLTETPTQTALATTTGVPALLVVKGATILGPVQQVPNEVLFNLTLDQLESYLEEALKTPEMEAVERLADRKAKLKTYLEEKKSPLAEIVNTLAELKHWKLVLAISNSESSLGKRCYNNNCSGIGVEPGHPLWRDYGNKADWAKDLDKLIGRRYKDWTLEEMNGVYNQPGSRNWLMASKQILGELQERNIE